MTGKPWGKLEGVRPSKLVHKLLDDGLDYWPAFNKLNAKYGISEEKFSLLWRVAAVERPVLIESSDPRLFSVYVGIPFCPSRCLYCSFPSHSLHELGALRSRFTDTLVKEIESLGKLAEKMGMRAYSVYLGGGTPTALMPDELDSVLGALSAALPGQWRELTVEAGRPDTLSSEHFDVLKKHKTGRISINPQTMHAKTLEAMGRCHSPGDVVAAVEDARRVGLPVINMDLIIGLPGENDAMTAETARRVLEMKPENITIHVFSRKRASRFNEERDSFVLPSPQEASAMHRAVTSLLDASYHPYYLYRQREILGGLENIGYSLPGRECVYNVAMIEERHNIIGLGCGATSKYVNPDFTLTNKSSPRDVRLYLERVQQLAKIREKEISLVMET
jgi:oxygen-independent coproporphyrinogen-3 oxidase